MKFRRTLAALAAMAMSATALTSMISASALEGAGTYTGSAEYVGAFNTAIKAVVEKTGTCISAAYWDNGVIGDNNKGSGIIDRRFNVVTQTGTKIINAILGINTPAPDVAQ